MSLKKQHFKTTNIMYPLCTFLTLGIKKHINENSLSSIKLWMNNLIENILFNEMIGRKILKTNNFF